MKPFFTEEDFKAITEGCVGGVEDERAARIANAKLEGKMVVDAKEWNCTQAGILLLHRELESLRKLKAETEKLKDIELGLSSELAEALSELEELRKLKDEVDTAPWVYSKRLSGKWDYWAMATPDKRDTHRAKLVGIEELK